MQVDAFRGRKLSLVPIGCADVAVYPGDIIVGDAEGVVVIPARMASRIAQEAYESMQYDTFAAKEVARGRLARLPGLDRDCA